jgi:lysyl-tRNA synthetase class 2
MEECEALIPRVASTLGLREMLRFRGQTIELSPPWERISVEDAFQRYAHIPMKKALAEHRFDEIMVEEIEPHLGRSKPAFLYDYPGERAALARLKKEDPSLAERFELYIGGLELANAFSELIDAKEQRNRFLSEQAHRRSLSKRSYPLPEKFLEELESMPPAAGIALGVDRLVMVLLDGDTIDDVVAFTPEEL